MIYKTLETEFYHISKHHEVRQIYPAMRRIFSSLLDVSKCDERISLLFDILHEKKIRLTIV